MDIETGGPAFPTMGNVGYKSDWQTEEGMTLRDWFAGQALTSLLGLSSLVKEPTPEAMTQAAYKYADAMLKARKGE